MYGNVGQSAYGAAKAAIANLTIVTALEMRRYGVTANAIAPVAATRMTATAGASADDSSGWHRMDAGNSAPVVAYLASDEAAWLTGQVLRVEGDLVRRARTWELAPGELRSASGERFEAEELVDGMRRLYGTMPVGVDAAASLGVT